MMFASSIAPSSAFRYKPESSSRRLQFMRHIRDEFAPQTLQTPQFGHVVQDEHRTRRRIARQRRGDQGDKSRPCAALIFDALRRAAGEHLFNNFLHARVPSRLEQDLPSPESFGKIQQRTGGGVRVQNPLRASITTTLRSSSRSTVSISRCSRPLARLIKCSAPSQFATHVLTRPRACRSSSRFGTITSRGTFTAAIACAA